MWFLDTNYMNNNCAKWGAQFKELFTAKCITIESASALGRHDLESGS